MTDANVSGTTTHYLYDANDARVEQDIKIGSAATTTTKYWNQFYETTGATTTMYVYAGGQLVATIEGNGTATSTNVIHTDHLGGTNVVSDGSGTLKQLVNYYPYGGSRQNQQTSTNFNEKRKFIGQYADDAVTLSYLNARYYDGNAGRFIAEDPILLGVPVTKILANPQALNYYAYANDNPINLSDPSGQITVAQQIQTLTLQVQVLQTIVKLYQSGATSQANAAFSRYQGITSGGGQAVNTPGDRVENYSQGSGVANIAVNQGTKNYAGAVMGGITVAAAATVGYFALPEVAATIGDGMTAGRSLEFMRGTRILKTLQTPGRLMEGTGAGNGIRETVGEESSYLRPDLENIWANGRQNLGTVLKGAAAILTGGVAAYIYDGLVNSTGETGGR